MLNGRTKVTGSEVQAFLRDGKRTVKDVAGRFGVTAATARKHILALVESGSAAKTGTRAPNGTRGRSPNFYSA